MKPTKQLHQAIYF